MFKGNVMFEHVTAYPNGDLVYEYKDTIVTERKNTLPIITIKLFNKESDEPSIRSVPIPDNCVKFRPN